MEEKNNINPAVQDEGNNVNVKESMSKDNPVECRYNASLMVEMKDEIGALRDLFVRRLNEDKQKAGLIKVIEEGASFAFVEPFLSDIILLLDRLEKSGDDFVQSASEELYEIIHRRGVTRIEVADRFDPALHKAVRVQEDKEAEELKVENVVRNGYTFSGKVLRPAEVVVIKPVSHAAKDTWKSEP